VSFYFTRRLLRLDNETVFRIDKQRCRKGPVRERSWEELMRGVAVGTGKRLDEVGQRLATMLTRLFTSRDLQESKARLEEAQRVAHVGYWVWNLDTDRATGPTKPTGSLG
jgi:hypothetical protein